MFKVAARDFRARRPHLIGELTKLDALAISLVRVFIGSASTPCVDHTASLKHTKVGGWDVTARVAEL